MSEDKKSDEMNQTNILESEEVGKKSVADNTEIPTSSIITEKNVKSNISKKDKLKENPLTPDEVIKVPKKLTETELATLDYVDFNTPARMLALGRVLCKSALVPLATPADVVVALMTGNELGLPFVTSVNSIYPINGRATLSVHLQKALLLKAGIIYEKIEDYVPIYLFVKKDKEGNIMKDKKEKPIPIGRGTLKEKPENAGKSSKPVDYRTTYKFSRMIKRPDGQWKELTATSYFTWLDAIQAELIEKDNYKHHPKRMLDARAFAIGAREIGSDVLGGLYSPSELSETFIVNAAGEEVPYEEIK